MAQEALQGSRFAIISKEDDAMTVLDPWGTEFRLVVGEPCERDVRGTQPAGQDSEGLAMRDLTLHAPADCDMEGIGRFYNQVLGAPILHLSQDSCQVSVGPQQTLTFVAVNKHVKHEDLVDDQETNKDKPVFLSNYGPHVSMYVTDLASAYRKADELGVAYVNPRFKRRAYTLQEAVDDCMFRIIDIVDPENGALILKLEHEIRSVVKMDGTKYKSCPFYEIPDACINK